MDQDELQLNEVSDMRIGEDLPDETYTPYPSIRQINIIYDQGGVVRIESLTALNKRYPDDTVERGEGTWNSVLVESPLAPEIQAAIDTIQNAYITAPSR